MKVSLGTNGSSSSFPVVSNDGNSWYRVSDIAPDIPLPTVIDVLAFEMKSSTLSKRISNGNNLSPIDMSLVSILIPFEPRSYRDFMLFEEHYINAARGFVRKYLPKLHLLVNVYEKLTGGKTFPKLKPKKRWYEYPIFYLGNHLNFVSNGAEVQIPEYTKELDYELELGVIICKPLKNATPKEAEDAIGGFVVFNDFSARDCQISEIEAGFGPMKSKNFINAMSDIIVTADEILPFINDLKVNISINNKVVAKGMTAGMHHNIPAAIAYASWEEQLYPGEFFGTGTIPNCSGIENGCFLTKGDKIKLEIEKIGTLENFIV